MDSAGAGKSATRLHLGLKSIGLDSNMLVLYRTSSDSGVIEIDRHKNVFGKLAKKIHRKAISLELAPYRHTRGNGYDLFSNVRTIFSIREH